MPKHAMVYSEMNPIPPDVPPLTWDSAQPRLHPGTTAEHGGSRCSEP